eukprot:6486487-Amphidinium_carterae.1
MRTTQRGCIAWPLHRAVNTQAHTGIEEAERSFQLVVSPFMQSLLPSTGWHAWQRSSQHVAMRAYT